MKYKGFNSYVNRSISKTFEILNMFIDQHSDILSFLERNKRSNLEILANPQVQDQSTVFETVYNKFTQSEEYMSTFLLERADIFIFALDMTSMKSIFLRDQRMMIKELSILYLKMIKERGQ